MQWNEPRIAFQFGQPRVALIEPHVQVTHRRIVVAECGEGSGNIESRRSVLAFAQLKTLQELSGFPVVARPCMRMRQHGLNISIIDAHTRRSL
jgi:hypothetical protein